MPSCRLIIQDEVNIKLEGLPVDVRRKITAALKFEVPYARHMPQYKLGRWDGKIPFFNLGGTGFVNHLNTISEILTKYNYTISDIEDNRQPINLDFEPITETYWADKGVCWPAGHPAEGEKIMLRDYQVEAINNFLANPQSLQEIATGAGKTITTATLSHIAEQHGRLSILMGVVVLSSNYLVQFPINYYGLSEILTYGAFSYPIAFLITDLANRFYGKFVARKIVYIGFFIGIIPHLQPTG